MNEVAPIDAFLQRYEEIDMSEEEFEGELQEAVDCWEWEAAQSLLSFGQDFITRGTAKYCLLRAIQNAPLEAVAAFLERLPEGEYAAHDTYEVEWITQEDEGWSENWEIFVQGTLVMHAVAVNRPDVLRLLLERGHDVNGASPAAAEALLEYFVEEADFEVFQPLGKSPRPESRICMRRRDFGPRRIPFMVWKGATPLALAVLMGYEECARVLVEWGAWLEETPSVSAAMHLAWRSSDADYGAARRAVLEAGSAEEHRPVLKALVPTCSAAQLKEILRRYSYDTQELAQAACHMLWEFAAYRKLWEKCGMEENETCRKLHLIGGRCPEALCEPRTLGILLTQCCGVNALKMESFLPYLKGRTLDISHLRIGFGWLSFNEGKKMLETLAQNCTLVMDRDAVPPAVSAGLLRQLIKHVSFLPPLIPEGVSGLTLALLMNGNLRLLQKALEEGIIWPGESVEDILLCQKDYSFSSACRMALLTTPRPAAESAASAAERPIVYGCRKFSRNTSENSMPLLTEEDWQGWLFPTLQQPNGFYEVRIGGELWQVRNALHAACMEGRGEIVEALLKHTPKDELPATEGVYCPARNIRLWLTPLCAAAFAGQTEIVRLLLRCGAPADEFLWGSPSVRMEGEDGERAAPFPPVSAALLGGWQETADLLTACGAVIRHDSP